MSTRPQRSSKPLHNFSFPCLKWGNQRFLRCVKSQPLNLGDDDDNNRGMPNSKIESNPNEHDAAMNIGEVREKLMVDLKVAAKRLKVSILEEDETASRPWNLRTRRAACKAPNEKVGKKNLASLTAKVVEAKEKKNEKAELCVSLSKQEIENDFLAMVGTKPPKRPKKRPRIVQRQLDVSLLHGFSTFYDAQRIVFVKD